MLCAPPCASPQRQRCMVQAQRRGPVPAYPRTGTAQHTRAGAVMASCLTFRSLCQDHELGFSGPMLRRMPGQRRPSACPRTMSWRDDPVAAAVLRVTEAQALVRHIAHARALGRAALWCAHGGSAGRAQCLTVPSVDEVADYCRRVRDVRYSITGVQCISGAGSRSVCSL